MKKQHIEVEKRLLIKASVFFVLILITSFFVGIVIGRHGAPVSEILPEDEMRDSLDACKYEVQNVLYKYNAKASALSRCLAKKEKATPVEKVEKVEKVKNPSVSKLPAPLDKGEQLGKVEKVEKVEKVAPVEPVKSEAVKSEPVEPVKSEAVKSEPVEPVKSEAEKKVAPPPVKKHKKCLYAIQLFSDTSKDNARKALSRMTDITARLETAMVRERTWYRIRYGCYTNKKEAREALQTIKERYEKAIIVAH